MPAVQNKAPVLKGSDADARVDSPPHGHGYLCYVKFQATQPGESSADCQG